MAERRIVSIADTSFVIAVINQKDRHHKACFTLYQQLEAILAPQSVVVETAIGLSNHVASGFLQSLFHKTKDIVTPLDQEDFERAGELLAKYHDTRLDFVDASVIALAERLKIATILTLDQRDFRIVQPAHIDFLTLLP